jgi:hypothetical protein
MTTTEPKGTEGAGPITTALRITRIRMDGLQAAIHARDWAQTELQYDQVYAALNVLEQTVKP